MNWSQWLLALWLFIFCPPSLYADTSENAKAFNLAQLKALSNNSFSLRVTNSRAIQLEGQWPTLCAEKAQIRSQRRKLGIGVRIFANKECFDLLNSESNHLAELPQSPLSNLLLRRRIEKGEPIYIESTKPRLNLDIAMDDVQRYDPQQTSPLLHETDYRPSLPETPSTAPNLATSASNSGLTFRQCNPRDYGSNDPHLCYGRHGLDLNADAPIGGGTKLRGSTTVDFVIPEKVSSPLGNDIGFHFQISYDGSNSEGDQ
jgi:hypothetical protein